MQPFVQPDLQGHGLSFTVKPSLVPGADHELAGESMLCMIGHARSVPEASVHPCCPTVAHCLPCHAIVRLVPLQVAMRTANAFNLNSLCFQSVSRQPCSLAVALHARFYSLAEVHSL